MRIGIDARLYGNKHTGIGRYAKNLILNLAKTDRKNTYIIFGKKDNIAIQKAIAMYLPITINLAKKMPILDNHLLDEIDVNQLQSFFDLLLKEGEINKPVNAEDILLPIYAESK